MSYIEFNHITKEYKTGEVVSQDPVAGSKVMEGHTITINLNKDKKDISGYPQGNIKGLLDYLKAL